VNFSFVPNYTPRIQPQCKGFIKKTSRLGKGMVEDIIAIERRSTLTRYGARRLELQEGEEGKEG